jgi:hypothetical protein
MLHNATKSRAFFFIDWTVARSSFPAVSAQNYYISRL